MPPRKRVHRTASTEAGEERSRNRRSSPHEHEAHNPASTRQWTDEEEMALLRSVIRMKPVGMHKHFRMFAILENLRSNNPKPPVDEIKASQVWAKLEELYNLEALDEREDDVGYTVPKNATEEVFTDFALPDEDFKDEKFGRRLAPGGTQSPPLLPFQLSGGQHIPSFRQSTIEDSEDPRSSPPSTKGNRGGRGSRVARGSRLAAPSSSRTRRGGQTSRSSVEASVGEEGEEEEAREDTMELDDDEAKGGRSSMRRSGRRR